MSVAELKMTSMKNLSTQLKPQGLGLGLGLGLGSGLGSGLGLGFCFRSCRRPPTRLGLGSG